MKHRFNKIIYIASYLHKLKVYVAAGFEAEDISIYYVSNIGDTCDIGSLMASYVPSISRQQKGEG